MEQQSMQNLTNANMEDIADVMQDEIIMETMNAENLTNPNFEEENDLIQDLIAVIAAQQKEMEKEVEADFLFHNRPYTRESFVEEFHIDEKMLDTTIELLKQKGHITELHQEKKDKCIVKATKEAVAIEEGKNIVLDEIKEKHFKLQEKRQGVPTYSSVEFEFGIKAKLDDFRMAVYDLNLESEVLLNDNEFYVLRIYNITEKDLGKLSMLYKTNKVVEAGVARAQKTTESAVKAVDYAVKNVATPVGKASFGAMARIGKTIATGLFRLGAVATTETIECTREAIHEIKHDPNIVVAKAELIQTKNDLLEKRGKSAGYVDGITINR